MQDIPLDDAAPKPGYAFGPFGHVLLRASKALAIAGGLVFVLLVAMSIVSIVGPATWKFYKWRRHLHRLAFLRIAICRVVT